MTEEQNTKCGYVFLRPKMMVSLCEVPPTPMSLLEKARFVAQRAAITTLAALFISASIYGAVMYPKEFATGFIIGFVTTKVLVR